MGRLIGSAKSLTFFKKSLYVVVVSLFLVLLFADFLLAQWVDADGSGQESINISKTVGSSWNPSLRLDSSGKSHIAWGDSTPGNAGIYYLEWNGTAWVDADGSGQESIKISPEALSVSLCHPSLYLDGLGNPHIACEHSSIYYLKWDGTAWVDADGSGQESKDIPLSEYGDYPSLCLDSSGNPHIAWGDYTPGNAGIYYLEWNGTAWVDADGSGQESIIISSNVISGTSYRPSLCLDNFGNPHIAWHDNSSLNFEIYYLKWNGAAWVDADGSGQESINISSTTADSGPPSLCLDSFGNAHIAWPESPDQICYLKWNGTGWVDADGSGRESINIRKTIGTPVSPSFCLDSSGNPCIAWADGTGANFEISYLKWNGTAWVDADGSGQESKNISNTNGDSYVPCLCLDSLGRPHIAWEDDTVSVEYEIFYLERTGPCVEVSRLSLGFGEIPKPASKKMTFTISNSGWGTLEGTITADRPWIGVEPTSFKSNNVTVSVTVHTDTLEVWKTYTGTVTIDSNGGVKKIDISVLPTCVKSYPNPYSLSSGKPLTFWGTGVAYATIKIYTLSGELVKTLKETNGEDKIMWDGRNENGERIVRGIYFFTAKNPKERNTGKFTVVR